MPKFGCIKKDITLGDIAAYYDIKAESARVLLHARCLFIIALKRSEFTGFIHFMINQEAWKIFVMWRRTLLIQ
ncbi:uncharacterized protein LOC143463503 isoform X4 [Clavelina lepadiformis]|uniref:uncharacterized protein LOC143463503 isoform X4 n=1 Tax=Clavelina lepadiformis TaxID=159417 RepID=UPI0040428B45